MIGHRYYSREGPTLIYPPHYIIRKLAEVVTEKLSALEKNDAVSQRLQLMEKENNDIRLSLQEQHKLLMEKKAQIMDAESTS